ncbi:type VII secretion protein EccCa [Streptomyces albireticuli]|uniref:Type VII secretion protein EccC n=1 Tax=Streptomyces albireticuli TaxID=1940 RepID=A0A2A2DHB3_9ACTN|nr:type VII secretion protein EccCa [Streptomyces albireticuli]MCD9145940.1 type VII secretion protein EccCa [Streptomyces albireticuli]MCD9166118.1 type VII secretion protein EccCa [Streptomyces albireticuli]MCD9196443.1 type VII secretion protein EccCa [Streptomyces albireticuli]PAU50700.1 type VII secretion protein EccC [Streptomyces albireticuli]
MSQIVVSRPPRALPPEVPGAEIRLEAPPELPRGAQDSVLMQLLPTLGMASSMVYFFMPGAAPMMKIMGVMMMCSTLGMTIAMVVRHRQGSQGQTADMRRDYLKYLAQTRRTVRRTAKAQRDAQFYLHPSPDQLWSVVAEGTRLWERRASDDDFAQVRVGLGTQQLSTPLVAPETAPIDDLEPLTTGAMQQFLATHGSLDGMPVALSLRAFYHVTLSGEPETVHGTARALVAQLVTLHSPEDLVVAVVSARGAASYWEWAKWLPHVQVPGAVDGAGARRLIGDDLGELEDLLRPRLEGRTRFSREGQPLLDQPHVVVVLDGGAVPADSAFAAPEGLQGVTIVEVVPGDLGELRGGLSVVVEPGSLRLMSQVATYEGVPDTLPMEAAEALARQLAPLRVGGGDGDEPLLANLDFTDLLGLGDAGSVDVARTWRPRSAAERLRVPIGVSEDGAPVMLDLKEAAQDGMGPHGLCVGATGSGKSELLRTLVLGLAVTHSSENLNFVLADFKGGATFAGMSGLPHVAAVITNLADDLTLVDRMRDSITGELQRRQELLRAAGNYANIHDYEKARAAGAALEPLASLVLVIDEFSELLTAKPDFIDMFIQIGRIGRSLGVHLLLASQRLEEGRLRGLETYLSYRIGLRTFSAAESRTALGVPDAYHLPSVPGSGYLKFGTDEMTRFKAAYVSGTYRTGASAGSGGGPLPIERRPVLFTADPVPVTYTAPAPVPDEPRAGDDGLADTVLDVIVRRVEGQGPPAHQVWLPPLDRSSSLDELLPPLSAVEGRGLTAPDLPRAGRLSVPIGLVDKPFEQRRDVLYRDFSGAAGNMLVVGGPQSGKSTLMRTLVSAFALTHTPAEVQFYGLDFGGGGMSAIADLPHVSGVASRLDPERVRRTVAEVAGILARREEYFRAHGVDSIGTYRRLRASGEISDQPWGDVFLIVDGWANFRQEYEMLEGVVADIAGRGLGYGIHIVVTASRNMEVRASLKDQLLNRLELRLGDTMDSEFDRKVAANVPAGVPGRGQLPEKLHFMAAQPRIDADNDPETLTDATAAMVRAVGEAWSGPGAPGVRLLPRKLRAEELPKGFEYPQHGVAIGIDETNLEPVFVDFETDPFFLVFGESESGKTAVLRLLAKQITERYGPDEAKIVVGDYRRTLLDVIPDTHLLEYAPITSALTVHANALNGLMERRAPQPDITPQQLRDRSWWSGPRFFVIVDDYELVSTSSGNPLAVLTENLPFARDVGVRFIIARSSAGASRSMFEQFMQRVRELGAQGIVLSGDPGEGDVLGGVRPRPMPPGRGYFVSRKRGTPLMQVGWVPEEQ